MEYIDCDKGSIQCHQYIFSHMLYIHTFDSNIILNSTTPKCYPSQFLDFYIIDDSISETIQLSNEYNEKLQRFSNGLRVF